MKKILILGNSHLVVFGFRGELIERLISDGYDVTVAFPNGPFGEGDSTSKKYGCRFIEVPIDRRGTNLIHDYQLFKTYKKLINKLKPDIVLAYTVKCDVYGGIACRLLRVPFIPNITGLGKGLAEGGLTSRVTTILYKLGIREASCVFFQNESDKTFFDKKHIRYKKGIVLPGSGVNLEKFKPLPYPTNESTVFIYIARVMKAKGIEQYLDAAEFIKNKYPNTEFHICGYCEEEYEALIDKKQREGIVVYHGLVSEIIQYEKNSHCIVLPSFHPEGISNVLLEAAALARPIITTNRAGCREVVDNNITGFLIAERDSNDLINKIEKFLALSIDERREMGLKGRQKIEKEFDRQIVVETYSKEISRITLEHN